MHWDDSTIETRGVRVKRGWLSCIGILAIATAPAIAASADRKDRDDRGGHRHECHEKLTKFHLDDPGETGMGDVTLDQIVPEHVQHLIVRGRDSLTGVWVSELELFTNVNPEACKVPKADNCRVTDEDGNMPATLRQPLEGACPTEVQAAETDGNMYKCEVPLVWTNNTVANYELSTGSIYSLNVWRIWGLYEKDGITPRYLTPESVMESGADPDAYGYVFMNGVRNADNRVLLVSSVGEVVLKGSSTGGHPDLADRIVMSGEVHDSNVGRVILSNTLTDTAVSLVYAPGDPREAVWKINLRKEPHCIDSSAFNDLRFPSSTRKIRIKKPRDH